MGMERESRESEIQQWKGLFNHEVTFFKKSEVYKKIGKLVEVREHFTFDPDHPENTSYIDIIFDKRGSENLSDYSYRKMSVECDRERFFLHSDDKENTKIELTKANVGKILKKQFKQEGVRIFPNLPKRENLK